MNSLSVVIIACNEERHIHACVQSAQLLEPLEILVIDSGSTDATRTLAQAAGARVLEQPWLGYVAQRQFGDSQARGEWILALDADEQITAAAAGEIQAATQRTDIQGAALTRRNWFLGSPLHCATEAIPRLARRGAGHWTGARVHERLRIEGPVTTIQAPIEHAAWPDLATYNRKHDLYARLMAEGRYAAGRRFRPWQLLSALWSLPKFLLLKGGWREGSRALVFACAHMIYSAKKSLYLFELGWKARG